MTEAEWLECVDPRKMLPLLRGKASDRNLRLFTTACARLVWEGMTDRDMKRAVETAERFADGLATSEELHAALAAFHPSRWNVGAAGLNVRTLSCIHALAVCCCVDSRGLNSSRPGRN